jgi:hypothetical protein
MLLLLRSEASAAVASKEPADKAAPVMPKPLRKERRFKRPLEGD